jgi:CO/xanthine dehydrogenase FAD-binding subunit
MKTGKKCARVNAKKTDEALPDSSAANVRAIAGGTDLVGPVRFEILPGNLYPQIPIKLRTITPSLDDIKEEKSILKIGALTHSLRIEPREKACLMEGAN